MVTDALSRKHAVLAILIIREWKNLEVLVEIGAQSVPSSSVVFLGNMIVQPVIIHKIGRAHIDDPV